MSTTAVAFAWIGLALGAGVLLLALVLFDRVLRPLNEIKRYVDDTLNAGLAIARNLDGADEIVYTRELATALPGALRTVAAREGGA
jgi:hypothetical protein